MTTNHEQVNQQHSTVQPSLREQVIVYGLFLAGAVAVLVILFGWG